MENQFDNKKSVKPEVKEAKPSFFETLKKNPMYLLYGLMGLVFLLLGLVVIIERLVTPTTVPVADIVVENAKDKKEVPDLRQYEEEIENEGRITSEDPKNEEIVSMNYSDQYKKRLNEKKEKEEQLKKEKELADQQKLKEAELSSKNRNSLSNINKAKRRTKIVYVKQKGSEKMVATEVPYNDEFYEDDGFGKSTEVESNEEKTESKPVKTQVIMYKAVIHGDQNVVAQSIVKIRLTEDAEIDGIHFPKHTIGYGSVKFGKNRVVIDIHKLGDYEINAKVFDAKDHGEGIYYRIPEEVLATSNETKDKTVSRTSSNIPTSKDEAIANGVNILKDAGQAINKNMKKKELNAPLADQYRVLIK